MSQALFVKLWLMFFLPFRVSKKILKGAPFPKRAKFSALFCQLPAFFVFDRFDTQRPMLNDGASCSIHVLSLFASWPSPCRC